MSAGTRWNHAAVGGLFSVYICWRISPVECRPVLEARGGEKQRERARFKRELGKRESDQVEAIGACNLPLTQLTHRRILSRFPESLGGFKYPSIQI